MEICSDTAPLKHIKVIFYTTSANLNRNAYELTLDNEPLAVGVEHGAANLNPI
jgi:hypothetical protein